MLIFGCIKRENCFNYAGMNKIRVLIVLRYLRARCILLMQRSAFFIILTTIFESSSCDMEEPHCASELHSSLKIPLSANRKLKYCVGLACSWSPMGKRRSSVHQRWAAGPRFKGELESILKPSAISHQGDMLTVHQRGVSLREAEEKVYISHNAS